MLAMKVKKKALHVKPEGAVSGAHLLSRPVKQPRVACYLRVSSRAQTYDTQLDAIMRTASSRGDQVATIYEEKISTRVRTGLRPELTRLRLDAQAGKISTLYVFKLDRLARSGIRDTFEIVEELRAHGVKLASVADGFDLEGPMRDPLLAMMAWAAQMERQALGERISAARVRIEAAGGRWGRPSRLSRTARAQVLALRAKGRSIRAIAIALKIPHATVGRVVKEAASS
jgi:DNA invertase Pin-like site-specific DNA recombinase